MAWRQLFQFNVRAIAILTLIVAIVCGWWLDRQRLVSQLNDSRLDAAQWKTKFEYEEKFGDKKAELRELFRQPSYGQATRLLSSESHSTDVVNRMLKSLDLTKALDRKVVQTLAEWAVYGYRSADFRSLDFSGEKYTLTTMYRKGKEGLRSVTSREVYAIAVLVKNGNGAVDFICARDGNALPPYVCILPEFLSNSYKDCPNVARVAFGTWPVETDADVQPGIQEDQRLNSYDVRSDGFHKVILKDE